MPRVAVEQLEAPPRLDEAVSGALIDGSITNRLDLPARAEFAFTLPTPAGESPPFHLIRHDGVPFWYVTFHGVDFLTRHSNVEVAFTRTWYVLHRLEVRDAISGAAAGSVDPSRRPGDVVILDDFIDFSTHRPRSILTEIWDHVPWIGASFVPPMCPELTAILRQAAGGYELGSVFNSGTVGQFEGHRFESPAEIRRARRAGADVVHHHQASEAIYARELGIHFAAFNYISDIAADTTDGEAAWLERGRSREVREACAEILLEAMARAARRQPSCDVCPQDLERQPVEIPAEAVRPREVYR